MCTCRLRMHTWELYCSIIHLTSMSESPRVSHPPVSIYQIGGKRLSTILQATKHYILQASAIREACVCAARRTVHPPAHLPTRPWFPYSSIPNAIMMRTNLVSTPQPLSVPLSAACSNMVPIGHSLRIPNGHSIRIPNGHSVRIPNGHSVRIPNGAFDWDTKWTGHFFARPKVLLTGGWDNTIQFWDMRVGHSVKSIFGPHLSGDSLDICGDEILTGSWWVPVSDKFHECASNFGSDY